MNNSVVHLTKKYAVIYIRVSSSKQVGSDHHSLQSQEEMCKNYCRLYGYTIKNVFRDEGLTGRNDKRDGLQNALSNMQTGDSLVIYSISRLSRNMRDFSNIMHELADKKQFLISVSEHFDSNTPNGNLMMNILGSMAEFESLTIGKRTQDTLNSLMNKGRIFGNVPYGYKVDKTKKGRLIENHDEQEVIKFLSEKKEEGLTIKQIVDLVHEKKYKKRNGKKFCYQTIRQILLTYEKHKDKVEKNNDVIDST